MAIESYKVVPSGTVGKQILAQTKSGEVVGYSLVSSGGITKIAIRSGILGVSGTVVWEDRAPAAYVSGAAATYFFPDGLRFDRGLHVTVIGTGAVAYILVK